MDIGITYDFPTKSTVATKEKKKILKRDEGVSSASIWAIVCGRMDAPADDFGVEVAAHEICGSVIWGWPM